MKKIKHTIEARIERKASKALGTRDPMKLHCGHCSRRAWTLCGGTLTVRTDTGACESKSFYHEVNEHLFRMGYDVKRYKIQTHHFGERVRDTIIEVENV